MDTTSANSQKVASPAMVELVLRMWARMLEYEEEVRTGKRIPNSILEAQRIELAKAKGKESRRTVARSG